MREVRKAKLDDLAEIAHLFNLYRVFYKQATNIELATRFIHERLLKNDSEILLIFSQDQAVGFTQMYPIFSSVSAKKSWVLNDLFVLEEFRGKGFATDLLLKAKEFCHLTNAKGLALETAKDNPAQALYEKLGWVKDDDFIHYFWTA